MEKNKADEKIKTAKRKKDPEKDMPNKPDFTFGHNILFSCVIGINFDVKNENLQTKV